MTDKVNNKEWLPQWKNTSQNKKITEWLDNADEEAVQETLNPLLEQIDHIPQGKPTMESVEKSIEKTVKLLEESEQWNPVTQLADWLKKEKSLMDKITYLISNFWKLFSAFLSLSWTGQWQETWSKLVAYNELDYSQYETEELWWTIDPKKLPSVQAALANNTYSEWTILHELIEKIKWAGSITKRLAWTAAYTNAKTMYKHKYTNKDFTFDDYEKLSGQERIQDTLKPWDLVVIWSWQWWMANNVLRDQSMGNEHIMLVGNDGMMYHSTMNKWENNDQGWWFEKKLLFSELDGDRAPCRLSIIRPPASVNKEAMLEKAKSLVDAHEKNSGNYWFSKTDAVTTFVNWETTNSNFMNCAKFVWNCLLAWWYALPKDSWDPSTYFDETWFSIEYFGTYTNG